MIEVDIILTVAIALGPTGTKRSLTINRGSGFLPFMRSGTEVIPSKLKRYGCMIALEQLPKNKTKR